MRKTWVLVGMMLSSPLSFSADFSCKTPLQAYENPNVVKGDFAESVKFKQVILQPNSVGFGASAQRADEITVHDGKLYLLNDAKGKLTTRHQAQDTEGAVVMVVATPNQWRSVGKIDGIDSFDGLAFAMDSAVDDTMKCGDKAQIAFKIKAKIKSVKWSTVTGPKSETNHVNQDVDGWVIGVYSKIDKEHLHMVKGYNLHTHVVIPGLDLAGHIHDVELADGAELFLPIE